MLLYAALALARPTEGGSWSFDDTDVVTTLDSPAGMVRVWYSTDGPNVVKDRDDDGNGLPDFAENVAATAEDVLVRYEAAGFRLPVSDEGKGGSDAVDAYLVDFGGDADGLWSSESCEGATGPCSGYFTMENDFSGYGYSDVDSAIAILTSHELFHGVQAAYAQSDEVWFLEGTATWAEHLYDPYNEDFVWFCSAYLTDTGRSLNEPPSGPVPEFAYATALWWWFLADLHGDDVIVALMDRFEDAPEGDDLLVAMSELEAERGSSLWDDFSAFARMNLATGSRASADAGAYPFAAELGEVEPEAAGPSIVDEERFYPLAATYYLLDWPGGDLWFATGEAGDDLAITLHAAAGNGNLTDVLASLAAEPTLQPLGTVEAGEYWLVVSNPTLAEDSTKLTVCLGTPDDLAPCAAVEPTDTGDTGGSDTDTGDPGGPGEEPPTGCGCETAAGDNCGMAALAFPALALLSLRRRRPR